MPRVVNREPIVQTGVAAGALPVQPGKVAGISKMVHHENFASGGYVVGHSVATHQPGVTTPEHNHRGADELFQVLSGYGIITVNGTTHYVQTGDSVYVPAGVMHKVAAAPNRVKLFTVLSVVTIAPGHEKDRQPLLPTSA